MLTQDQDIKIQKAIENAIQEDPTLSEHAGDIQISVLNSVVELSGYVANDEESNMIEDIAYGQTGVHEVRNNLFTKEGGHKASDTEDF